MSECVYDEVIVRRISGELEIDAACVASTVLLLRADATIPFIARYRKERTGNLDEVQIRAISEKLAYHTELQARKETIRKSIAEQGKLTPELESQIESCFEKQRLEDLYLPFKPKKRTRATVAKEKGLEPLAELIWAQGSLPAATKEKVVAAFLNQEKGVLTYAQALQGALDIIAEKISDDAQVRSDLREYTYGAGTLVSSVQKEWANTKSKYENYYNYAELLKSAPSHRILAVRRGSKEGVLAWKIDVDQEHAAGLIADRVIKDPRFLFAAELDAAIRDSYKRLLAISLETEVFLMKLQEAEQEAITVFSKNLKNLLLAPPAGHRIILGVDPGFRTGCKLAVIDTNGNFKEYRQIFPHPPQQDLAASCATLMELVGKYRIELIAIGNGTASKETDLFVRDCLRQHHSDATVVMVSEAGASVYSASETAIREFPDLDVTVRGAISIARRLQDPLAELVKIDPKSIGVGQYQHDVNQVELKKSLDFVVESSVNFVGVDLNTASAELLSYVSGIGRIMAKNIVNYRSSNGSFKDKKELLKVSRFGDKVFEQCAGFLRIPGGINPLDNSAIHPENYELVERMAFDLGAGMSTIVGNQPLIARIDPARYVAGTIGLLTLNDIVAELKKPGWDPRREFSSLQFNAAINEIGDLKPDMLLEGVVTNVANFGAFVDIGVHQDGLIHISKMSRRFVKDPHDIVSVGDALKVKVLTVDKELKRIGLELVEKLSPSL